ncbi:hypothetical protein ACLSY0_00035 [Avibacterium avium]|uniref:hypothetical protein n=1 Tax=Avibacterium avium TaxID=751 RepID=UPI003BF8F0DF
MQEINLDIYRGDDTAFQITFNGEDAPFSVSGGEFAMQIKPTNGEGALLTSLDGTISQLDENSVIITFSHALTKDWSFREAKYDLQMTKNGKVKTLCRGKILLTHDITK